jgi:HSP20 family protein
LEEICGLIRSVQALQEEGQVMLSKTSLKELDLPERFGPTWAWVDELFHDDDTIIVRAELPGVDPEKDVVVEVVDNELIIRAQRSESHRSHGDHVYRSEIRYGSFLRSVPIPTDVDESKIEATYKDGMLEIRMHTTAEVPEKEPHRVAIKRQ